jgi:hypothetical protein
MKFQKRKKRSTVMPRTGLTIDHGVIEFLRANKPMDRFESDLDTLRRLLGLAPTVKLKRGPKGPWKKSKRAG